MLYSTITASNSVIMVQDVSCKNNIENFSLNIFSVGRNKTFFEALDACSRENSSLPVADTNNSRQHLLNKMKADNLSSVWLGLYRQDLERHQWSDKSVLGMPQSL